MYTKIGLYNLAIEAKRALASTQDKEESAKTWKEIARLYHLSGQAQERLVEIGKAQESIRATWTDEQKSDIAFRDPIFDAISSEQFCILTSGADTLTISQDKIKEMAE